MPTLPAGDTRDDWINRTSIFPQHFYCCCATCDMMNGIEQHLCVRWLIPIRCDESILIHNWILSHQLNRLRLVPKLSMRAFHSKFLFSFALLPPLGLKGTKAKAKQIFNSSEGSDYSEENFFNIRSTSFDLTRTNSDEMWENVLIKFLWILTSLI